MTLTILEAVARAWVRADCDSSEEFEIEWSNGTVRVNALAEVDLDLATLAEAGFVVVSRVELTDVVALAADGSNYKGEYLRAKHGDAEIIALGRAMLAAAIARNEHRSKL